MPYQPVQNDISSTTVSSCTQPQLEYIQGYRAFIIKIMSLKVKIDLEEIGLFRKAEPSDIIESNIVYLIGDNGEMYKKTIIEVYNPNHDWKAFCANDGCRYGLYDLYVLKDGNNLQKRIDILENTVSSIRGYLNAL